MIILPAENLSDRQLDRMLALLFPESTDLTGEIHPDRGSLSVNLLQHSFVALANERSLPFGAIMLECMAGAIANVWGPSVAPVADRELIEDLLLQHCEQQIRAKQPSLVQAFRRADQAVAPLTRFGMKKMTTVWFMNKELQVAAPSSANDAIEFTDQAAGVSESFKQTLMATFDGSLDCPELNGVRTLEQIIEGYVSSAPDRSSWWLASWRNLPVGVLILAQGAKPGHCEISYFGVTIPFRKRGLGRVLLDFAVRAISDRGATNVDLIVDERNQPAIKLYTDLFFRKVDSRDVYLRPLQLY